MIIMCYFFSDQEPPSSLLKLNMIADKEKGWLLVGALMFPLFSFCTYLSFQYGYVCVCSGGEVSGGGGAG